MQDIIQQFYEIPATCVSDAMEGLHNIDPAIKPLRQEYKICGRAFTVKMPAGDNMVLLRAIREAKQGDILVVDAKGYLYAAAAGDFVVGLAHILGIGGMVIDGTVRDIVSISEMRFPVFCKGGTLACSKKHGIGEINVPVSCGGMTVYPGDIIVGDADGVAVIPKDRGNIVLQGARDKLKKDQLRAKEVLGSPEAAAKWLDALFHD